LGWCGHRFLTGGLRGLRIAQADVFFWRGGQRAHLAGLPAGAGRPIACAVVTLST
jgi:hypothetical protein